MLCGRSFQEPANPVVKLLGYKDEDTCAVFRKYVSDALHSKPLAQQKESNCERDRSFVLKDREAT